MTQEGTADKRFCTCLSAGCSQVDWLVDMLAAGFDQADASWLLWAADSQAAATRLHMLGVI